MVCAVVLNIINIPIKAAGGTADGRIGTDTNDIKSAITEIFSDDGVMVFYDIGSALMSTEIAVECLPEYMRKKIYIMHAPIFEGSFIAAVNLSINKSVEETVIELNNMKTDKSKW